MSRPQKSFLKKIGGENPHPPITLYTISEKHNIESTKFRGGHIIISKNLGGRGTDVKVDQDVNLCGGLFVLLTHYSGSRRVEKQVFGRTGRKGNPGVVQMILRGDNLAPAYQGQPVEIMRQLREEYEVQRIKDMETHELLEIKIKEDLFGTFCEFLDKFDGNFTKQERDDLSGMGPKDVPECFKDKGPKFDYQPALNALKETWALWLTLHEEHIRRHKDISVLKADLLEHITNRGNMLLNGKSQNFYDHIKQATGRTDLHLRNKTKCDYEAKSYWKDVEECDPFYSAVALYNQAFITINMGKDGYKTEAMELLERAKTSVDVILGVLVCALSFGAGTQIGFSLISEGVSDMIEGITGMISGTFNWVQWAISKSISIGMSLLSAGFSAIKKVAITAYKVLNEIEEQQRNLEQYDQDGRHDLPDVIRLKDEFLSSISESVSQAFVDACAGHMSDFVTRQFKKKVNAVTGKVVDNVLGRHKTEGFFQDRQHKHDMKSASQKTGKALSETETKELLDYAEKIGDVNRPASALDIYILTNSDLLHVKGIQFKVVDQHGKTLSEESYPGMNSSAGQITLRLTKEPEETHSEKGILSKAKDRIQGVESPYSGHFDIIQDGKVIPVRSENQNCLYHALAQAISNRSEDEIKSQAVNLRNNVKDQIKGNLHAHRINEEDIAYAYQLGLVGPYKRVKNTRLISEYMGERGVVEADHIPPKSSLKLARDQQSQMKDLQQKNPKLYDMINRIGSDSNGENLPTMRVLKQHHRNALTTGASKASVICRLPEQPKETHKHKNKPKEKSIPPALTFLQLFTLLSCVRMKKTPFDPSQSGEGRKATTIHDTNNNNDSDTGSDYSAGDVKRIKDKSKGKVSPVEKAKETQQKEKKQSIYPAVAALQLFTLFCCGGKVKLKKTPWLEAAAELGGGKEAGGGDWDGVSAIFTVDRD
ncbi:hypothetical protein J4Q44_G00386590 [Coregonus suidteri]|uniref:SecA family profile domain-containing protein n=1 Tax=Coregonus suidteri TaxID=861788 RepID=A0AAN8KL05_9TELE